MKASLHQLKRTRSRKLFGHTREQTKSGLTGAGVRNLMLNKSITFTQVGLRVILATAVALQQALLYIICSQTVQGWPCKVVKAVASTLLSQLIT